MRKNMVMDLIYRGFIYAANYSESHYNPRRSQIKTALALLVRNHARQVTKRARITKQGFK